MKRYRTATMAAIPTISVPPRLWTSCTKNPVSEESARASAVMGDEDVVVGECDVGDGETGVDVGLVVGAGCVRGGDAVAVAVAVAVGVGVGVAGGVGGACERNTLAFCPLIMTVAGPEMVIVSSGMVPVKYNESTSRTRP